MKQPLFISILLSAFLLTFSCKKQGEAPFYSFDTIELENASSHNKYPEPSSDTAIKASIYGIQLKLNVTPDLVTKSGTDTRRPMQNKLPIQEVVITSDKDFNSTHLAGDTLNTYFRLYNRDYFRIVKLADFKESDFQNPTYYYDGPFVFTRYLLLIESPTVLGNRKFYVKMTTKQTILMDSVEINLN